MNRRIRFLGALLVLLAFSAYYAESLWASTCMPGADGEMAMMAHGDAHLAGEHAAMGMDGDAADEDGGMPSETSPPPPCPLGAGGAGSSCVAASLPGAGASFVPRTPDDRGITLAPRGAGELLFVSTLFRPPRA